MAPPYAAVTCYYVKSLMAAVGFGALRLPTLSMFNLRVDSGLFTLDGR